MAASKSEKSKASDKKVFDVAKPGKSAPDASGRPVIVGHKPMIADPMVNATEEKSEGADEAKEDKTAPIRSAKKIVPLSEQATESDQKAEPEKNDSKEVEDASDTPDAAVTSEEAKTAEDIPAKDAEEKTEEGKAEGDKPETDENAAVDALANQASKKKEGDLTEEEKQKIEAINKLIEDKTYNVKITQANKKRNTTLFILLGLVLLVLGLAVLAIDAGIVESNISLPFDLISN